VGVDGNSIAAAFSPLQQLRVADLVVITAYFSLNIAVGIWPVLSCTRISAAFCLCHVLPSQQVTYALLALAWVFISVYIPSGYIPLPSACMALAVAPAPCRAVTAVRLCSGNIAFPRTIPRGRGMIPLFFPWQMVTMPGIRMYLSDRMLLLSICTKTPVSNWPVLGALSVQVCLGWDLSLSTILMLMVAGLYTIAGRVLSVCWPQMVLLWLNTLNEIGGSPNLEEAYLKASRSMHLFRDPVSGALPWTGMTFGLSIIATCYWCIDQVIIQWSISAKSLSHTKAGCILGSHLRMLPLLVITMPGMISRVLYPDTMACVDPKECTHICGAAVGCSDIICPKLVMELMPRGLHDPMIAVMMAVITSSLTSTFNSSSILITMGIRRKLRPGAGEQELLLMLKALTWLTLARDPLKLSMDGTSHGSHAGECVLGVSGRGGIFSAPHSLPVMGSMDALCLSFPIVLFPAGDIPYNHCVPVPGSCSATPDSHQPSKAVGPPSMVLKSITEPPFWSCICSINAITLMCVNVFFYAHFA
uniref:Uncharacterized protein n=1 Tax=Melopsittacus undulatus TaxID=13146 RepID=A0A8C6JWC3_MELUD